MKTDATWGNRALASLLKIDPKVSAAGLPTDIIRPTLGTPHERVRNKFVNAIRLGLRFDEMFTLRTPDGYERLVRSTADPITQPDGRAMYLGSMIEVGDLCWQEPPAPAASQVDRCMNGIMDALEAAVTCPQPRPCSSLANQK